MKSFLRYRTIGWHYLQIKPLLNLQKNGWSRLEHNYGVPPFTKLYLFFVRYHSNMPALFHYNNIEVFIFLSPFCLFHFTMNSFSLIKTCSRVKKSRHMASKQNILSDMKAHINFLPQKAGVDKLTTCWRTDKNRSRRLFCKYFQLKKSDKSQKLH